ncbi:MAG TPA: nicotinate phosphoribosyltransferase [Gammaproteobacteria bacterium]|nr:nicotinate phosphoribosyltransferase [Gammaproteobacteria bacterium]
MGEPSAPRAAFAPDASALLTDLYQLTMLQAYLDRGMQEQAVFELFVRHLPPNRNFLVAAGLEQALDYLAALRFTAADLDHLRHTELFREDFVQRLAQLRFTGDVDAMPEGTVFFANEPILRVTAPLPEAQLVESRLVNLVHFQTLIATKAARCVLAAPGKTLVDFGMRRAHGSEAAILAARASYLAGFAGTATVIAKPLFDIPIFGTMAHSFVQAHESEAAAFEHFAQSHLGPIVLLIDTYDTETGARRVVELARRLAGKQRVHSVRLDSGDLDTLARRVRQIFDEANLQQIGIFASGNLDEHRLRALVDARAPIDGFGIGASLDVSEDSPVLDCVYKLQEYAGKPRRKRSAGKATWPGRKQVYRHHTAAGRVDRDVLSLVADEEPGEPLLQAVMRAGVRVAARPNLEGLRAHARRQLGALTPELRALDARAEYSVHVAPALTALARRVDAEFR